MTEAKSVKISYDVAGGDFDRAGEASSGIKRMLQKIGIPADIVRRIAIGTYEAEMNVLIHAGGGKVAAEIFQDHTGIPDIKLAMQEGWSTAPDYIRQMGFGAGMGLPNMMKCSDKFDIQSKIGEGTSITMEFKHQGRTYRGALHRLRRMYAPLCVSRGRSIFGQTGRNKKIPI